MSLRWSPGGNDPRHGRSAACGRTPRGPSVGPRGKPRSVLPALRGRCARICLPSPPEHQEAPLPSDGGGIAQERPLAPRRCTSFVAATTRSATPRSLAARREENALRDPACTGVARSHVPCGRCPQPAVRAGGAGTDRCVGSRPHPSRSPGGTVLGGLPSPEFGPSLLRPVPPPPAAGRPLASFRPVPAPPRDRSWGNTPRPPSR